MEQCQKAQNWKTEGQRVSRWSFQWVEAKVQKEEEPGQLEGWEAGSGKISEIRRVKKRPKGDFPRGLMVKSLHFHCLGNGFDPWLGN